MILSFFRKDLSRKMKIVKMQMFQRMSGHTLSNRIRNENMIEDLVLQLLRKR